MIIDATTIGIIVLILAAIAFFIYRRSRPAPQGTYDDRDVRSSGNIGGGPRAHDDPKVRSSGSIGGGPRAYDTPEVKSGGSIGGQSTEENLRRINQNEEKQSDEDEPEEPTYNDRTLKSGGSFGSS